ncbi:hypothetical protein [Brevibacillus porteri]|uniref:hypothetical protein n=1 Tax=Brevibacillus porteri TaxID=2126350 RepID=UPI003D24825C
MNGNLTLDELYAAANEMCRKWWETEYTGTIRLTSVNWHRREACFAHSTNGFSVQEIRMSRKVNARFTREHVLGNLLHELVHWRLFTQGIPHTDADPEFVRECIRVGAPFSLSKKAQRAAELYGGVTQ